MNAEHGSEVCVVIPAKDESATIADVVTRVLNILPNAEVIVVDDGSTDGTGELARSAGARVITHKVSRGNGASIRHGARLSKKPILVMMDGDGQHSPEDIPKLLEELDAGYDLVVGSRIGGDGQATVGRWAANTIYNGIASFITGQKILDLTSGFRATKAAQFVRFLPLLPNGFSYPTTSTMAFFRSGLGVSFVPVRVGQRQPGTKSHIRPFRDGGRFFLVIFKVATLYSPLKLFFPASMTFLLSGLSYYIYTYLNSGRFTNFGALLLTTSVVIFLMGLISEQITQLLYSNKLSETECDELQS